MKEKSLGEIIKEYQNWIIPWVIIILTLILVVFCFLLINYDIAVVLPIITSLIVAITTVLVMLITSAENRKNIIFQIRYENDLKYLIKFKKWISDISEIYGYLTIHKNEYFKDRGKYYLHSTDYLILMFLWLSNDDEFISRLPKIIKTKINEVNEYYLENDNDEFSPERINKIMNKIDSSTLHTLKQYPLTGDSPNSYTRTQMYYDHIETIKKFMGSDAENFLDFSAYKHRVDDITKMSVFINEIKDYFDENSFEQIIYDDIEGIVDIDISYFDDIKDFPMMIYSNEDLMLEDNNGKYLEFKNLPNSYYKEFEESNFSQDYLEDNIINNPRLGYQLTKTREWSPVGEREVYLYQR